MEFVVYLINYNGNKLPPKYIGSSSKTKLLNGYRGSVSSKKYSYIFNSELKEKPELFTYTILEEFSLREDATLRERELQLKNNVVQSDEYFNMAIAAPNGYFGMDVSGENNPNFGNEWNEAQRENQRNNRLGKKASDETKKKLSAIHSGKNHWNYGKHHSGETKEKIGKGNLGKVSPFKGKTQTEIYGEEQSKIINRKISEANTGTFEEKFGEERAGELKSQLSERNNGKGNPNFGNKNMPKGKDHWAFGKTFPEISKRMKGRIVSEETKEKLSKFQSQSYEEKYGIEKAKKFKENISKRTKGENNSNAKKFKFTNPDNIDIIVIGKFQSFCKDNNIGADAMYGSIKTGEVCKRGKSKGWKCEAL